MNLYVFFELSILNKCFYRVYFLNIFDFRKKKFKIFFLLFLLFFWNCSGDSHVKPNLYFEPSLQNVLYYQRGNFSLNEEVFEKSSYRLNFLYFASNENAITYTEIFLSSYTTQFLNKVLENFPNSIKKYSLVEQTKKGRFHKLDSKRIKIEFDSYRNFQVSSNEFLNLIEEYNLQESKPFAKFREVWVLKNRDSGSLWKEFEQKEIQGNLYAWFFHESGDLVNRRYPYTEYRVNNEDVVYSRLLGLEENIFTKYDFQQKKIFKLYANKDYVLYYLPDKNLLDIQNNLAFEKNSKDELTLLKNQFPILLYKKNLKTNGN